MERRFGNTWHMLLATWYACAHHRQANRQTNSTVEQVEDTLVR